MNVTIDMEDLIKRNNMEARKTWDEFRTTGLLLIINQLLHIFGWAIVCRVENDKVVEVYPARVSYG